MSLRIAKEYERGVVFRLGRLAGKRGPGLYLLFPFIERQILIDQRIVTAAVEKQEAITRDDPGVRRDGCRCTQAIGSRTQNPFRTSP